MAALDSQPRTLEDKEVGFAKKGWARREGRRGGKGLAWGESQRWGILGDKEEGGHRGGPELPEGKGGLPRQKAASLSFLS